jgi:hypothetical protein
VERRQQQSMRTRSEALQRLRHEIATAEAARRRQLRGEGQELGTRVGMIVRGRLPGRRADRARRRRFALVEAVRNYCREVIATDPASRR